MIQQSVSEIGDAIMRLHAVIEHAALPPSVTDWDMTDYFRRLDEAAERIVELTETTSAPASNSEIVH